MSKKRISRGIRLKRMERFPPFSFSLLEVFTFFLWNLHNEAPSSSVLRFLTDPTPRLEWQKKPRQLQTGKTVMHKCQKCSSPATLHITEIQTEGQFEEVHLCEQCASKYLYDPTPAKKLAKGVLQEAGREDDAFVNQNECPMCGLKFVEFRNSGRLGCPHDYQAFRD